MNDTTKLNDKWIDYLKDQPETGMGYQMVRITMPDQKEIKATVLNCQHLLVGEGFPVDDIEKIEVVVR